MVVIGIQRKILPAYFVDTSNFNDRYLNTRLPAILQFPTVLRHVRPPCTPVARYDVTFEVGTANETVTTGVFLGGGAFGNANNVQLYDADGDGIYSRTLSLPEGMSGGYKFVIDPIDHWSYSTSEDFLEIVQKHHITTVLLLLSLKRLHTPIVLDLVRQPVLVL